MEQKSKWPFRIAIAIIAILIIPWLASFASDEHTETSEYTGTYLAQTGLYLLLLIYLIVRWGYYKLKPKEQLLSSN